VRDIDTVARWGGEEFAILLPRAGLEETAIVAERIRTLVATRPLNHEEHAIPLTVSVGYACRPFHSRRQKELVLMADHALQTAKRNGRNRVEVAPLPEPALDAASDGDDDAAADEAPAPSATEVAT
jgi:diguanylate cyclase (GGDEF)-like protein